MMEPMASIMRDRRETRHAAQAFRDMAVLLLLLLAVVSVRFQSDEADPPVEPLRGGVQAATPESAAPAEDAEPAVLPALATPDPAADAEVPPIARVLELPRRVEMKTRLETRIRSEAPTDPAEQTRVLVFLGDEVHEIRLPGRFSLKEHAGEGSAQKVDVQVRS
jgi:hypothetical protein